MPVEVTVSSAIAKALGLEPSATSDDTQNTGCYLYIHADGYNQSLHSVDVDELESSDELYAEESEPVELGIAIRISEPTNECSSIFQHILDGTIIRGLVEVEKGYLAAKNEGLEAQGVESKHFSINASCVDLIDLDRSGDWECLYRKNASLEYVGESDEFEFDETDENVFTAAYTIESIKSFALADLFEDGSVKVVSYDSSDKILDALEAKGLFNKPGIVERFRSMYSGKTFAVFGTHDWCDDQEKLNTMLIGLGLRSVDETDGPEIIFVGKIDPSIDGIYARWEAIVSQHPIQHGKFTEPLLSEVYAAAS